MATRYRLDNLPIYQVTILCRTVSGDHGNVHGNEGVIAQLRDPDPARSRRVLGSATADHLTAGGCVAIAAQQAGLTRSEEVGVVAGPLDPWPVTASAMYQRD
jgi:hypothetical protein